MDDRFITLAIRTEAKAFILRQVLEEHGIEVQLEAVDGDALANGYYIRIKDNRLSDALNVIEEQGLFSYNDKKTYSIDDGRNRILVAVDFSKHSRNACIVAFNIAKKMNAKVKILHVYHNIYFPMSFPFADQTKEDTDVGLLDKARKQMLDLCLEIDENIRNGELPSVNYSYSIREGIVEEEIKSFTDEYKPVLIVLGTRGKDSSTTKIIGDVTADIVEMTNIPVMAVPGHLTVDKDTKVKHIVFLTNLSERDLSSFDTLVHIIKPYDDVRVTLVHINIKSKRGDRWTESELAGMKEYLLKRYPNLNFGYELMEMDDIFITLSRFIERENVSVVALNTRKRSMFGRMFLPSFSRKILEKPDMDMVAVLVLRG